MKELNDRARALLQATQFADDPTDEDFDRVHGAVAARIATALAASAAATVTAKTATAATSAAASIAPAAAAGAGAGAALPAMKIAVWVVAVSMTAGIGSAVVVKTRAQRPAPAVLAAAPSQALAPATRNLPPSPVVGRNAPEAVVVAAPPPPVALPAAPARQLVPSPSASAASSLEAEVALVREARRALNANDTARAMALLDEHAARFPNGTLVQDRDALQVFATCAAGQEDAARELATVFLSRHPGSSYALSVRSACAKK